ncbi:putative phosphothreonine lyase domain-containing protein [Paraburkholderia metrosideri]|uniref:DUF1917 domain-containing protein n=1 Tax=Paraburkholderia metrosideri TaxID=580937 RepID=A0ABM8NC06_9BURK|nr:putative phosphothreonine lyase domain-containg protein [Paraburkholderia metrosideri]CAD6516455.1 hypothetical protein LMG28140_00784 [Paraburkholderia metrosideri]
MNGEPRQSDKPSEDLSRSWHFKKSPGFQNTTSSDMAGKWCIFVPRAGVDAAWEKIVSALDRNQLWCAKVSTALRVLSRDNHVICVYTTDWTDTQDLMRARDVLRALGYVDELGYKRDIDTLRRLYGPDEWYLRA